MSQLPAPTPENFALAEREYCRQERERFITRHLSIQDKDGVVRRFNPLKRFQRRLGNLLYHIRYELKLPVDITELKARRIGNSSYWVADQYCEVRDKGINGVIIAHDDDTSKTLLDMTHLYYAKDDLIDRPLPKRGSINELVFADFAGKITIDTANNVKAGTGDTIQYLIASECSKWAKGKETAGTLMQAIAHRVGTTVIRESTAWGFDEYFQPTWKNAYDYCRVSFDEDDKPTITFTGVPWQIAAPGEAGWNGSIPIFVGALEDPDCLQEFTSQEERDRLAGSLNEYEVYLAEQLGAPLEYIKFRRWAIANRCGNNLDVYNREFPETPELAFISSGRPKFDRAKVSQMPIEKTVVDGGPARIGTLEEVTVGWSKKIEFRDNRMGYLTLFRRPVYGHRYVVTLDTAEGITDDQNKNPDATVCHCYDLDAGGEQVARIAGQISPKDIVEPWYLLMRWYNMAFGVPERNNTGEYPCQRITEPPFSYPEDRLFHRQDEDKMGRRKNYAVGWKTTSPSRHRLVETLAQYIDAGWIRIHSSFTQEELLHFVTKKSGKVEADTGFHDDEVFAAGLACIGMEHYPVSLEQIRRAGQRDSLSAIIGRAVAKNKKPELDGYGVRDL